MVPSSMPFSCEKKSTYTKELTLQVNSVFEKVAEYFNVAVLRKIV